MKSGKDTSEIKKRHILGYLPVYPWINCEVSLDTFSGQISDGERQTSLATPFSSMIMEFGSGNCKSTFRQEGRSISLSKQVQLSQLKVSVF